VSAGAPRKEVAVIAGASPGFGSALAWALVDRGYGVAALGRTTAIDLVATEVQGVRAVTCELADVVEVHRAFTEVEVSLGPPSIVIYNAHKIELAPSSEVSIDAFVTAWRASCLGAFVVAKRALPAMRERGGGTIIFTGATGSVRGGARSAAFASAKFALRGLAQSLARELSPEGIHVAHVVLDGLIWTNRTRHRFPAATEDRSMPADSVVRAYLALIDQDATAWTHELDLRPATERF
jgi:NAD(P)-dependent dehydrogenase (short-subunit alcohol dehydrogenase family)